MRGVMPSKPWGGGGTPSEPSREPRLSSTPLHLRRCCRGRWSLMRDYTFTVLNGASGLKSKPGPDCSLCSDVPARQFWALTVRTARLRWPPPGCLPTHWPQGAAPRLCGGRRDGAGRALQCGSTGHGILGLACVCTLASHPGILNDSIMLRASLPKRITCLHYFLGVSEKWVTLKHLFI